MYENYAAYHDNENLVSQLSQIQPRYGKFAIWGNRDYGGGAVRQYQQLMEASGFYLLQNEGVAVTTDSGEQLLLAGLDDALLGEPDLQPVIAQYSPDNYPCSILMIHEPDLADQYAQDGFDLMLAGHSHGGQVDVPFLLPLTTSLAEKYQCAIVLVGHMNKAAGNKAAYRGMGSIDFFAVARSVLLVGRVEGEENIRAVVQIKNNLAGFGHPKAFQLSEDGFLWLGDYEITADEVLGGIAPKANKLEQAKRLLRKLAETNNAIQSNEVFNLAEEQNISRRTLENAKKELGVRAKRINNSWYWELNKVRTD